MSFFSSGFLHKKVSSIAEIGDIVNAAIAIVDDLLELEAGEDIAAGNPLVVIANKLYIADNTTNFKVVGLSTTTVLAGQPGTAQLSGQFTTSGLTSEATYFLGNGVIQVSAPSSGYVVRIGTALTATLLMLNIEEPILLT